MVVEMFKILMFLYLGIRRLSVDLGVRELIVRSRWVGVLGG